MRFPDSSAQLRLAEPSTAANRTRAIVALLSEARQRLAPFNAFLGADVFGYVCWNQPDETVYGYAVFLQTGVARLRDQES